jgi:glycerophosphoryl diester phosphodiesterase
MVKKVGKILLGLTLSLLTIYFIFVLIARPAKDHPFFQDSGVLVMAHQGGKGLWPENTLYAFEHAVELGVDVLEMDIHSTADEILVVMHDDTVDDTTDGTGPIQEYSFDELKKLDAGYFWSENGETYPFRGRGITVPALEELFEAFPDVLMNIEIKQREPSIVAPLCEMIHAYNREDITLVASFDSHTVKAFRAECPSVASAASESEVRAFFILNTVLLSAAYRPQAEAFQIPEFSGGLHVLTERFVESAARHNIDVHVWTVNEEDDMRRMIDTGVNGIITDYPDRLLNILRR